MKLFYGIILVLIVFVGACAPQVAPPAPVAEPESVPIAEPEAEPEPEVEAEAEGTGAVVAGDSTEVRYVGAGGFDPDTLTIITGSAVTWINGDDKAGAVLMFKEGKFQVNSGRLNPGAKFEYEFTEEGEYEYFWNLAFGAVSGKITVE